MLLFALHPPSPRWFAVCCPSCRNDTFSDCVICTSSGQASPAHKLVLSSASPVFKAMFTSSNTMHDASNNTITIQEAPPEAVAVLLQYMYGMPNIQIPVGLVVAIHKLADQYQVPGMEKALLKASAGGCCSLQDCQLQLFERPKPASDNHCTKNCFLCFSCLLSYSKSSSYCAAQ